MKRRIIPVVLMVAVLVMLVTPAAGARWVTNCAQTFVPGGWITYPVQVGWHYDCYGNQFPIFAPYREYIPPHFETRVFYTWVPD